MFYLDTRRTQEHWEQGKLSAGEGLPLWLHLKQLILQLEGTLIIRRKANELAIQCNRTYRR